MKRYFFALPILLLTFYGCKYKAVDTYREHGPGVQLKEFFQRTDHRIPLISAHRGGSYPGYPENCLQTFKYVTDQLPVLIECDVERAADGTLILMHDETLDRTTNGRGRVSDLTWNELSKLRLVDNQGNLTSYRIPTLRETLRWAKGRVILTVDVKRSVSFQEVIELVEDEKALQSVVMITYTLGAAEKMYRLNPQLMLSVTLRNASEFDRLKQSVIPLDQIVAFTGTSEPSTEHYRALHREGIYCILGTLGNLDRQAQARGDQIYLEFVNKGADIIATDRPLEVGQVLSKKYDISAPYQPEKVPTL